MEWSDERVEGRESGQRSRFPSLHREDATTRSLRILVVSQFPVTRYGINQDFAISSGDKSVSKSCLLSWSKRNLRSL
jgi:hypothetical protein